MTMKITVKNMASGSSIRMEVEPTDKISEIIESAAEFWGKDAGAYVLKKGKKLLSGSYTVSEVNIIDDDVLEMIPDPEGGI